ncbi:MAG: acylphosphatase [Candidatus Eisenbacteria bacterium]
MSENVRIRVFVRGGVQGVSFRYFTRRAASNLGLSGWVRNLPDGGVELEAQGPRKDVESLLEEVRTGPPAAEVEGTDVEPIPLQDGESGFGIRY